MIPIIIPMPIGRGPSGPVFHEGKWTLDDYLFAAFLLAAGIGAAWMLGSMAIFIMQLQHAVLPESWIDCGISSVKTHNYDVPTFVLARWGIGTSLSPFLIALVVWLVRRKS